jgi:hypothetical protein
VSLSVESAGGDNPIPGVCYGYIIYIIILNRPQGSSEYVAYCDVRMETAEDYCLDGARGGCYAKTVQPNLDAKKFLV